VEQAGDPRFAAGDGDHAESAAMTAFMDFVLEFAGLANDVVVPDGAEEIGATGQGKVRVGRRRFFL